MKKTIVALTIHLSILTVVDATTTTPSLDTFKYGAAWVVPFSTETAQGIETDYLLLGRESYGRDIGTYDAFGGKRDSSDEKNCMRTAAREFAEEGITRLTLNLSVDKAKHYIGLSTGNTFAILAIDDLKYKAGTVTCLTKFSHDKINELAKNFAYARSQATHHAEREKDEIAVVNYSDFEKAVKQSSSNSGVTVNAKVWHLDGSTSHQTITLRPIFVRLMRSYVENKPYIPGENSKIRFYTIE